MKDSFKFDITFHLALFFMRGSEQQVMKAKSRSKIAAVPTCTSNDDFAVVPWLLD